jgi:hypothetical protein
VAAPSAAQLATYWPRGRDTAGERERASVRGCVCEREKKRESGGERREGGEEAGRQKLGRWRGGERQGGNRLST